MSSVNGVRWAHVRLASRYLREFRGVVALTTLLVVATSVFEALSLGLVVPLLESLGGGSGESVFAQQVGRVLGLVGLTPTFLSLMLAFAALSLVKHALTACSDYEARVLSASLKYSMRRQAFGNLMALPLRFYYRQPVGTLIASTYTSTDEAAALAENGVRLLTAAFLASAYVLLQLMISPWLTLLSAGFVLVSYYFVAPRFSLSFSQGGEAKDLIDRSTSFLQNRLSGIKTIKAFGNERHHESEFEELIAALRQLALRIQKNKIIANLFGEPFTTGVVMIMLVIAVEGLHLGITELIAFFYAYSLLVPRVKAINTEYLTITEKLPHFDRVHALIDRGDKEYLPRGSAPVDDIATDIQFHDVWFRYPGASIDVLQGVTFTIARRQTTAIVGASGAGKTTIIDLLLRLHDPTRGAVMVNGRPLHELDPDAWHRLVRVVEQDAYLFHDTVARNIEYGKLEATGTELERAAAIAHAAEFIERLPQRYNTVIGERGFLLSGGQRQRLALARAVVGDPALLVLDEATSALDSESELLIQTAMSELRQSRTVVIIAHRLSTIVSADHIVILDGGRVIEEGTHQELLLRRGRYHRFYTLQTEIASIAPEESVREP